MLAIKEIRAREQAATKRPWKYDGENYIFAGVENHMVAETRGFGAGLPIDANGEFIAHSRQDVPDLLDEVETLVHVLENVERAFQLLNHTHKHQKDAPIADYKLTIDNALDVVTKTLDEGRRTQPNLWKGETA